MNAYTKRSLLTLVIGGFTATLTPPPMAQVQVAQVEPAVPFGSLYRIVAEAVADPHHGRRWLVNFALDLKNVSGHALKLKEVHFAYQDKNNAPLLEQVASAEQLASFLVSAHENNDFWSYERKAAIVDQTWPDFITEWQRFEQQGMRMTDLEISNAGGQRVYSGIFGEGSYAPAALVDKPWSAFLPAWRNLETQGYRMFDLEVDSVGGTQLYSGLFRPSTNAPAALVNQPWTEFYSGWRALETQGYRLFDLEVLTVGGTPRYSGLFKPGLSNNAALVNHDGPTFLTSWQDLEDQGQRMFDLETVPVGGMLLYYGLFRPGTFAPLSLIDRSWTDFLYDWQVGEDQGYRLSDLEIRTENGQQLYSGLFEPGPPVLWPIGRRLLFFSPQASFIQTVPAWVTVTLGFADGTSWSRRLPIQNYVNKTPTGSYDFPASVIRPDEYWALGARASHEGPKLELPVGDPLRPGDAHRLATWGGETAGSYWFGQQYAYDLGVAKWNGAGWAFCEGDCSRNVDYYSWEQPIQAASAGVVLYCWKSTTDNLWPGHVMPPAPGAPPGGNILWIWHAPGEVGLYAHLRLNSIPADVCPTDGIQTGLVTVEKGQFLGLAGNSGGKNSSAPHFHFHIQDDWTDNPADRGQGLPSLFGNISVAKADNQADPSWMEGAAAAPVGDSSSPSWDPVTLIRIDP